VVGGVLPDSGTYAGKSGHGELVPSSGNWSPALVWPIPTRMNVHEDPDPGVAGRSAHREAERRRERRLQSAPPKWSLRWLIASLFGPSATQKRQEANEKNWATGAEGERLLATSLARKCPNVLMLHDRRMPNGRANIDHIAVAATGVYVIDAKRYRGKIRVDRPLFGTSKLKIAGRDQTKLVDGLVKQVAVVQAALADVAPKVAVRGCLCFIEPEGFMADSGLPVLRTLKINGYPLYYPRRLAKRLNGTGSLTEEQAHIIHTELANQLAPA
jgi:Nuclease-related domain